MSSGRTRRKSREEREGRENPGWMPGFIPVNTLPRASPPALDLLSNKDKACGQANKANQLRHIAPATLPAYQRLLEVPNSRSQSMVRKGEHSSLGVL